MGAAHPWLELDNWPTKELPREDLERHIERTLTLTNLGVLGTAGKNGPIASPLEFYAEGLVCYIFPQPGSPKVKALQSDPRVCLAVANPMAGWACAQGAQLFGQGQFLDIGTPEWEHGMTIFKWQASAQELGKTDNKPPAGQLLKIDPDRVVFTQHFLRRDGYSPRQIWRRNG